VRPVVWLFSAFASVAACSLAVKPVMAIPLLDLKPYPEPTAGEQRWVIQPNPLLKPSLDTAISANPSDWRVQLLVGKELQLDCNLHRFTGRLRSEPVPGFGYTIYRAEQIGSMLSTRKACPGNTLTKQFIPLGGQPFVLPFNASVPIVVYVPQGFEVRYRLWKAEKNIQPALQR
jgi:ecotin